MQFVYVSVYYCDVAILMRFSGPCTDVMLVLYKLRGELKCDYVRVWSEKSASAAFHHRALHLVRDHLVGKGLVPNLRRVRVWTDGDKKAYVSSWL